MHSFSEIESALASMRAMLSAAGYDLEIQESDEGLVTARITAGPDACADCLVPKNIMRVHFDSALRAQLGGDVPEIRLVYPNENPDT